MRSKFDSELNETGEKDCKKLLKEVNEKILPGLGHWNHPEWCTYFPAHAVSGFYFLWDFNIQTNFDYILIPNRKIGHTWSNAGDWNQQFGLFLGI